MCRISGLASKGFQKVSKEMDEFLVLAYKVCRVHPDDNDVCMHACMYVCMYVRNGGIPRAGLQGVYHTQMITMCVCIHVCVRTCTYPHINIYACKYTPHAYAAGS
jgi:hypothetical protein